MDTKFENLREIARRQYNDSNCTYGTNEYIFHIDMVVNFLTANIAVFKHLRDAEDTLNATLFHDSIEDAKQSYNDICLVTNKNVADIVLAVTDVPAENRLMKHLLTMGKTVIDYRAIILKMCDIHANVTFSKSTGNSMYNKYVEEYQYRKPIFQKALGWYKKELNQEVLQSLWLALDEAHGIYHV